MQTVTLEYATGHLKELLAEASAGKEIVIVEDSRLLGRLVAGGADEAAVASKPWSAFGIMKGQTWMAENFSETPPGCENFIKPVTETKGWPFWEWFGEDVKLPDDLDASIPEEFWEALKA